MPLAGIGLTQSGFGRDSARPAAFSMTGPKFVVRIRPLGVTDQDLWLRQVRYCSAEPSNLGPPKSRILLRIIPRRLSGVVEEHVLFAGFSVARSNAGQVFGKCPVGVFGGIVYASYKGHMKTKYIFYKVRQVCLCGHMTAHVRGLVAAGSLSFPARGCPSFYDDRLELPVI